MRSALQSVAALEAAYAHIARTCMAGLPVMHPGLRVQAVGFAPRGDDGRWTGVLVTPWFMNLVRLPVRGRDGAQWVRPGVAAERRIGGQVLTFLGSEVPGLGRIEACSLFSPMHEFADHAAARATAQAVLDLLDAPIAEAGADTIDDAGADANGVSKAPALGASIPPSMPAAIPVAGPVAGPGAATTPPSAAGAPALSRRGWLFGRRAASLA